MGLYTDEQLQVFVDVNWITEEQKEEIINSKKATAQADIAQKNKINISRI